MIDFTKVPAVVELNGKVGVLSYIRPYEDKNDVGFFKASSSDIDLVSLSESNWHETTCLLNDNKRCDFICPLEMRDNIAFMSVPYMCKECRSGFFEQMKEDAL